MAALPYMPLFVADYLADTAHLTTQQHGAYMLLIMNYWQRGGPLPDDDVRLAKIARVGPREWARMRDTLSEFFSIADGQWSHSRITSELARVASKSLKSKKAAQASVQRRFGDRSTSVEPTEAQAQAHTDKDSTSEVENNPKSSAGGGKPPSSSYAFFGQTVRLKPFDLDKWRRVYHAVPDIEAELTSIDAWWQDQAAEERAKWFHRTAAMLNRKHQEALAGEERSQAPPVWDGMP